MDDQWMIAVIAVDESADGSTGHPFFHAALLFHNEFQQVEPRKDYVTRHALTSISSFDNYPVNCTKVVVAREDHDLDICHPGFQPVIIPQVENEFFTLKPPTRVYQ